MGRILGILFAIAGLFVFQQIHNRTLARDYDEVEATVTAYEEDCYFEKNDKEYFSCGSVPSAMLKSRPSAGEILRHAVLTYTYKSPTDTEPREVRRQRWRVVPGQFGVGHKQTIFVKKDDPKKILWDRLVV